MKKINSMLNSKYAVLLVIGTYMVSACHNDPGKKDQEHDKEPPVSAITKKPPSSYKDTLVVVSPAAVFFHPDTVQLEKFRRISSKMVYESTTHESFFQMRNSRMVLKKYWPNIKIIEAFNTRYLKFTLNNKKTTVIDLDTNGNMYGLYLFDPGKEPVFADMMNIETALGFYFKKGR